MAKKTLVSESRPKWGRHQGGGWPEDELGEKLLFSYNPYKDLTAGVDDYGIRKIGAARFYSTNNPQDASFWIDQIQSCYHQSGSEASWQHKGRDYPVRKALRIPYLVPDFNKHVVRDHLLVGYIAPTGDSLAKFNKAWTQNEANDPKSDVGWIGRLIMVTMFPTNDPDVAWGVSWPSTNWGTDATVIDQDPAGGYSPPGRPKWPFRGQPCHVGKSLLITYTVEIAGSYLKAQLLAGYEGGGAW